MHVGHISSVSKQKGVMAIQYSLKIDTVLFSPILEFESNACNDLLRFNLIDITVSKLFLGIQI